MHVWFWIVGWFLTVLAVTGNALVIWLVATKRRLRTTANFFIVSLAIADFCVGSFLFPAQFTCTRWPTYCTAYHRRVILAHLGFFVHASTANLCVMTADRYIAVALPLRYIAFMTPQRSIGMIATTWVFPAVAWIAYTVLLHYRDGSTTVVVVDIAMKCLFQILPTVLVSTATIHMLIIVRRHKKDISSLLADLRFNNYASEKRPSRVRQSPEASSTKVVEVVVLTFVLCYSAENYCSFRKNCPTILFDGVLLLLVLNAAANPLAYAFLKKDVKREVQTVLRSVRKKGLGQSRVKPQHINVRRDNHFLVGLQCGLNFFISE